MTKVMKIVLMILLSLNGMAFLSLLGYGLATGRFDSEKREQYLATWRGEKLTSPPAEEPQAEKEEAPQQASARIEMREVEKDAYSRNIQREIEVLKNMQFTMQVYQASLEEQRKKLQAEKQEFALQLEQQREKSQQEGFQKALQAYSRMKPKAVKEDFMSMTDEEAVRYLSAMKNDTVTRILDQFKTGEEQAKRLRVIKLLEQEKVIAMGRNSQTP
jgi:flagellar motility protein MotE (MotC chaperone)